MGVLYEDQAKTDNSEHNYWKDSSFSKQISMSMEEV